MAVNRRPLYEAPELRPGQTQARRGLSRAAGVVVAITLAGALLGNGLGHAPSETSPLTSAGAPSGSGRGDLAETLPAPTGPIVSEVAAPIEVSKVSKVAEVANTFAVSASSGLRVRSAPSVEAPIAGALPEGATVTALGPEVAGEKRAWVPVRAEGLEGWVAAEYLETAQ